MRRLAAITLTLLGLGALLGGCAAKQGPTEIQVPPDRYSATFDAARHVLRDGFFDLERVDAVQGVITTRPKHSAGVLTPWDAEQSTTRQEFEDVLQNQRRVVRVTFEPVAPAGAEKKPPTAPAAPTPPAAAGAPDAATAPNPAAAPPEEEPALDLREATTPLVMRVRVIVFRDYRPGWRIDTNAIILSSHSVDLELYNRGMEPDFETAINEDRLLAGWLAKKITEAAGK